MRADNSNHRIRQDASATDFAALRSRPLARSPLRARTPAEPICPLHQALPTFLSSPAIIPGGYPRTCRTRPRWTDVAALASFGSPVSGNARAVIKSYPETSEPSRLDVDFQ